MKAVKNVSSLVFLVSVAACSSRPVATTREPSSITWKSLCAYFFASPAPVGQRFQYHRGIGEAQIGVNPATLIPNKRLDDLVDSRLADAETYGRDQSISVNSLGFVIDGHHRIRNALRAGRSVDVVVTSIDESVHPTFLQREPLIVNRVPLLTAYELSHLYQAFKQHSLPYMVPFKNRDAELTWAHFRSLHPVVQKSLLALVEFYSAHPKNARALNDALYDRLQWQLHENFLNNMLEHESDPARLNQKLAAFDALPESQRREFSAETQRWFRVTRATQHWNNSYFTKIPVKTTGARTVSFSVKGKVLSGRRSGDQVMLQVPTELMKRPAWNPLVNIKNVASNTFGPPRFYVAHLALDGNFYIFDGNHRFSIYDSHKATVKVKVPLKRDASGGLYVETSGLRNYFDDIGQQQPQEDALLKLERGEITPESLVHPNFVPNLLPITERPTNKE